MALMVKSRRARSSSSETPYCDHCVAAIGRDVAPEGGDLVQYPLAVEHAHRAVLDADRRRSGKERAAPAPVWPTWRCRNRSGGDPAARRAALPPTHQASKPAPRACGRSPGSARESEDGGKLTSAPVRRRRPRARSSAPCGPGRACAGRPGSLPWQRCGCRRPRRRRPASPRPRGSGCEHDRLPFVDPAADGRHRAGGHVAAAECYDHHAIVIGPRQVQQVASVSHHHGNQRHPGREPSSLAAECCRRCRASALVRHHAIHYSARSARACGAANASRSVACIFTAVSPGENLPVEDHHYPRPALVGLAATAAGSSRLRAVPSLIARGPHGSGDGDRDFRITCDPADRRSLRSYRCHG